MATIAANSDEGTLAINGATKDFVGLRAVDGVSLKVRQGEILGLIGPNGSGKTTLINMVTGLLSVSAGHIKINAVDITDWSPHRVARAGVARTFQTVHLFGTLTVAENVQVAAVATGISRQRAADRARALLQQFNMEDLAGVEAGTLAFGLQRRVEVARALAMVPRFLLLDEPAAGLNETESDELLGLLHSIPPRSGCGILIVDHDMRLIMRLCDRVHVLNYGRTIAQGTPDEVLANPRVIEAYLGPSDEGR